MIYKLHRLVSYKLANNKKIIMLFLVTTLTFPQITILNKITSFEDNPTGINLNSC